MEPWANPLNGPFRNSDWGPLARQPLFLESRLLSRPTASDFENGCLHNKLGSGPVHGA